jgi:hypothetical protein
MWGATVTVLIAAAGVLYVAGPIAGLAVAALGSATLLVALQFMQRPAMACEPARILEVVDGGADGNSDFPPLQQKAS